MARMRLAWITTVGRWLLQILPGAAVFVGDVLLLVASSRIMGMVGGLLGPGAALFSTEEPHAVDERRPRDDTQ